MVQDVSPHVDSISKLGSHLIYFMPEGWNDKCGGQTVFYKGKLVEQMNPEPKILLTNNNIEMMVTHHCYLKILKMAGTV